jgi:hypothetical protein
MLDPKPAVGWRIWRLRDGRLHSWVVDHVWEPGHNQARCLSVEPPALSTRYSCSQAPGPGCMCGFWALWDLKRCLVKGRAEESSASGQAVIGLMQGWGTVAVHGQEGFRAQHAKALFLINDSVWDAGLDPLVSGVWSVAWRRWLRLSSRRPLPSDEVQEAADYYGVPRASLVDAVRRGLLAEHGVPRQQVESADAVLRSR